jgi:hypothetical protein
VISFWLPAICGPGRWLRTNSGAAPWSVALVRSLPDVGRDRGLWEIDVMQGVTTDGTEFSQTVAGVVAYNQLALVTETGLPTSPSTTIGSARASRSR